MPKIVLHYFNGKALGEGIRLILAYAGEEFEDHRVPVEQWPDFKPKTPFGQMPVLEIDGKQFSQSTAICRYLGRKYGLSGSDIEEDFLIDQNMDFIHDIRAKAAQVHYETDDAIKEKKREDYIKNVYPTLLAKLDALIQKNGGHLAANKLTWADFVFAGLWGYLSKMLSFPDVDAKYPNLKKLHDTVYALPQLQTWLASAPVGEF